MQLLVKVLVTIVFILYVTPAVLILYRVWTRPINLQQMLCNWFASKSQVIPTRDPKKIYQNGKEAGNITGDVSKTDDFIVFAEVCDTGNLDIENPFEYKDYTLKVTHIDKVTGLKFGDPVKRDVKTVMKCKILRR